MAPWPSPLPWFQHCCSGAIHSTLVSGNSHLFFISCQALPFIWPRCFFLALTGKQLMNHRCTSSLKSQCHPVTLARLSHGQRSVILFRSVPCLQRPSRISPLKIALAPLRATTCFPAWLLVFPEEPSHLSTASPQAAASGLVLLVPQASSGVRFPLAVLLFPVLEGLQSSLLAGCHTGD